MKLKTEIIERVNGRDDIKRSLLLAFNVSRGSIWRFLKENQNDGPLTTVKASKIICAGLNVSQEELFTEEYSNTINHERVANL